MADEPNTPPAATVIGTPPANTPPADSPKVDPVVEPGKEPSKEPAKDAPKDPPAAVDAKAFKLPEGFTANEKAMGEFATLANEFKLPQDAAQKLVDMHATALKQASETSSKYWGDLQTKWADENKAEFGPEPAKNPKIIAVSKLIDSLGEKPAAALREALEFSGMGNNPAVIRAFTALAEKLTEPGHAKGSPPASTGKTAAEVFYPDMKQG